MDTLAEQITVGSSQLHRSQHLISSSSTKLSKLWMTWLCVMVTQLSRLSTALSGFFRVFQFPSYLVVMGKQL